MYCYHCYWGSSKPCKAIYQKYYELSGHNEMLMNYSIGHIVWDDENMDDDDIQWCIDNAEKWKVEWNNGKYTEAELNLVVDSLKELLQVPLHLRIPPKEFTELAEAVEDLPWKERKDKEPLPENFPPPEGWL